MSDFDKLSNEQFLPMMKHHKVFLARVYKLSKAKNVKRVKSLLLHASDAQQHVLLEILRRIGARDIRLTKSGSEKVVKSKRAALLKRLQHADHYEMIKASSRENLTKLLCNFISLYAYLLHYLFNLDNE